MSRPPSRAPPPLPSLVTPSASPPPHLSFHRPDSLPPLKRRRLSTTPSRASSSSSLQDVTFDVEKERGDSVLRLLGTWAQLEERWTRRIDEDDVIDLRTLDVIENRGVLESMSKPREFGINKDSDAARDRASVDDEDDEDSDDDLDAISGFDINDRPIEDAYSDDNISTTDEDDGSPLQDPLPKPIGHYGRLDINNPKDADDLRAFLEAERLRKTLQGDIDDDDDGDEFNFEGDTTIVYEPHVDPEEVLQLSGHDDEDSSSEDELAAPEEKLSSSPRKKVILNVEPIRAVPKPSSPFKVPKLPVVSTKPSPFKNQQLQTPPRSSSIQSTDFSSLPSPLPSPISPPSRRSTKPAPPKEKIQRPSTSATQLNEVPRINLAQVRSVDKKGKGTSRPAAQVTKTSTEPSPRPSPSKKSRMHPEVVIVRPVNPKPVVKEKSSPPKKLETKRRPQTEESSSEDESITELPSSPLKGKSRARPVHVVSDSEDDEPLRKPPPRAPRPAVAVPARKRKRSSDAPRRASSQAVQVDSPNEEMHPELSAPARSLPRTPKRPKSRIPISEDEESPPDAGPSKYHSRLYSTRDTVSPEPYNKVKRRSRSRMQSADSDDEHYRYAGSSHQRSRSYFDPSLPPSSDSDYRNPYPPPYPPPAIWEAMHHLSSYFLNGMAPHGPPLPPNHFTPSRHQHPNSVYNTPTHPHPYPYAYDPNLSRGTLPPSSPEVESSPIRGRDEMPHRASSIVERSRSRGRRVSFKFEAQEEEDEPFQGKGKGRAIARPTRNDDVGTPPPRKRENSRTRQHVVGRSTVHDDTDSSASESEPDNRSQRQGRSKSRAQTPGPSMNKLLSFMDEAGD
ncbi:hypothetical protein BDZ89DRAFT_1057466 [Hymenopellis radicata]|nr:hypothetical protein BDZ89DRAFT_1057466 [Hymenopellis radicata]